MKRLFALALMLCVAFGLVTTATAQDATAEATSAAISADAKTPDEICQSAPSAAPATTTFSKPDEVLQPGVDYRAIFCTDVGPVYVDLLEGYAPIAVNSFVFLSQKGYYNNTTFHRVIQDFMAQGGDPTGQGNGTPGYSFDVENTGFLHFDKPGWLAMANTSRPNSNGSQFFITTADFPSGDFQYTIFGEVLEGQQNVDAIKLREPSTATEAGTGLKTVVIIDDPSTVKTTYTAPAQPDEADVLTAFKNIDTMLSEGSGFKNAITSSSGDSTAATAEGPESGATAEATATISRQTAEFQDAEGYQFWVSGNSSVCQLDTIPLASGTYTLTAFETADQATAALAAPALDQFEASQGLAKSTPTTLSNAMYTEDATACDAAALHAVTHWQRGRFLITAEVVLPATSNVTPDLRLRDFLGVVYEYAISDVLRTQLR